MASLMLFNESCSTRALFMLLPFLRPPSAAKIVGYARRELSQNPGEWTPTAVPFLVFSDHPIQSRVEGHVQYTLTFLEAARRLGPYSAADARVTPVFCLLTEWRLPVWAGVSHIHRVICSADSKGCLNSDSYRVQYILNVRSDKKSGSRAR